MKLIQTLELKSNNFKLALGLLLLVLVGFIDFCTGYELAFSLFYVLPVSLMAWLCGYRQGVIFSAMSAIVWFLADFYSYHPYSHPAIFAWNSLIRFCFFLIIAVLLSKLKTALELEQTLSRTDFLTGAFNSRSFYDLMQQEIDRYERYERTFTLVYIDLDNFKTVNDTLGHSAGDQVLRTVVEAAKTHLRKPDIVARLGGDEFGLLLPETDEAQAHITLSKLQASLLAEMTKNQWPITFSMGALVCNAPPPTPDNLLRKVDDLMYSVKSEGKNSIKYALYATV